MTASGAITSWQIDGETMETVTGFIFLGFKITADVDCSHAIKICLLLGRTAMTNPYSILKSRAITFPTKVHIVKAMVFPVVMYKCESLTIKKAECQEPALRNSARGKGHEEGGSAYAKVGLSLRSPPGYSRASTPKTRVCLLYCFVLSHLTLRGLSPNTISLSLKNS